MKKISVLIMLALSALFVACQKRTTEEERRAEVERQVQERLAAEHQQQQAQELAQREASVAARKQALKEQERAATEASAPAFDTNASTTTASTNSANEGSYSLFYNRLERDGDWIETGDYGYVFRPHEAGNNRWRPYTDGRWVYTEPGWTWVSNESFGWATYHYGRWTRLRGIGWVWVPGNEWAPAWVSWRKGGQYVGWAPLPPEAHFDRASGIRNWSDNYYDVGPDQYCFVSTTDFGEARVEQVIVPPQQNVTIISQTTNVTNITYNNTVIANQGPSYDELRVQSRVPIQRLRLQREAMLPGENVRAVVRGDTVSIPAPAIVPPRGGERPRAVKQTIKQAAADRGWEAVSDQREAEQARAKIRSEATAPPNAPPKKFVRPASAPNVAPAPSVKMPATPPIRSAQPPSATRPMVSPSPRMTTTPSPSLPASAPARPTALTTTPPLSVTPPQRNIPSRPPTSQSAPATTAPSMENATVPASATPAPSPQTANEEGRAKTKGNFQRRERPGKTTASPSASPQ